MYVVGSSSVIYLYINICVLSFFLGRRELGSRVSEFGSRVFSETDEGFA